MTLRRHTRRYAKLPALIARRVAFEFKAPGGTLYYVDRGGWATPRGGGPIIHIKKLLEAVNG